MKSYEVKRNVAMVMIIVLLAMFAIATFGVLGAQAEETEEKGKAFVGIGNVSGETLYNATNTYTYKGDNPDLVLNDKGKVDIGNDVAKVERYRNYEYYDMNSKKGDAVMSIPQITVLTPGLGGSATHWSNAEVYVKRPQEVTDEDGTTHTVDIEKKECRLIVEESSLFSQLAKQANADVYLADMVDHTTLRLVDLSEDKNFDTDLRSEQQYVKDSEDCVTVTQIPNNGKHIILLFQTGSAGSYNNAVYEEFNYMLSKVVYDVKCLNGGVLPKINLIGHSRGGITNLQYALDHPDMVASMFSMGTPYFGSDTANFPYAKTLMGGSVRAIDDITNSNLYYGYYERWNTGLYDHIDVHAMGGYSDTDFVVNALLDSDYLAPGYKFLLGWAYVAIRPRLWAAGETLGRIKLVDMIVAKCHDQGYADVTADAVREVLADIQFITLMSGLGSNAYHTMPMIGCPYFMNDVLVDLPSQTGRDTHHKEAGDYHFIVKVKQYRTIDGEYKVSDPDMPAIAHNLEARDPEFIRYIANRIKMGTVEAGYVTKTEESTTTGIGVAATVTVLGCRGNMAQEGVLTIPSQIDGYPVTKIDDYAFDCLLDTMGVTKVVIPSTVTYIGDSAFAGNTLLQEVEFAEGSALTYIGAECFIGCTGLTDIALPETLTQCMAYSFANCTSLQSLHLPANVQVFDATMVLGCSSLQSITVAQDNETYMSQDGVLYTKNGYFLSCYPMGRQAESFTVPESVGTIFSYAFSGNPYLQTVNLNNTIDVWHYGFLGCENLQNIQSEKLQWAYQSAFENTAWMNESLTESAREFYAVGKALVRYTGNESELNLDYVSVAPYAFANPESLTSVTLGKDLRWIEADAFALCENLRDVYILHTGDMVQSVGQAFTQCTDVTVHVPQAWKDDYENDSYWQDNGVTFAVYETQITLDANGGVWQSGEGATRTVTAYYGSQLIDIPQPQRAGHDFMGWEWEAGCVHTVGTGVQIWNSIAEQMTVVAQWAEKVYPICFYEDSKSTVSAKDNYASGQGYTLPDAKSFGWYKKGHTFAGWYDNPEYAGEPITRIGQLEIGERTYFAKWDANEYTVILVYNDGTGKEEEISIKYGDSEYIFPTPTKEGYIFNGWKREGTDDTIVGENGELFKDWTFDEQNVRLEARWVPYKFEIKFEGTKTEDKNSKIPTC